MTESEQKSSYIERVISSPSLILFLWVGTIIVIIITLFLAYLKARTGLTTVALHYNVIVGVDLLGRSNQLYFLPGASSAIALLNFLIYRFAIPKGDFLGVMAAGISLVAALVLGVAMLFLFYVN